MQPKTGWPKALLTISCLLVVLVICVGCRLYDPLSRSLREFLDGPDGQPLPNGMVVRVDELVAYDRDSHIVTTIMVSDCGGPGSVFGEPRAWETHYVVEEDGTPYGTGVVFHPAGTAPFPAIPTGLVSGGSPNWDQVSNGLLRVSKNWAEQVNAGLNEYDGCDRATAYITNEWGKGVWIKAIGGFVLTDLAAGATAKLIVNTILPPPSSWAIDVLREQIIKWAAKEIIGYLRNQGEVRCYSLEASIGDMRNLQSARQLPVDQAICRQFTPAPIPQPTIAPKPTATPKPSQPTCDFSKPVDLRPGINFSISGDEAFDTVVCGYVKFVDDIWPETQTPHTDAYFVMVDYLDEGFKRGIEKAIDRGNTVNQRNPEYLELGLGCYQDGRILGIERPTAKPYLDLQTESAILNSTPESLVSLVLSFEGHPGRGCGCCHAVDSIRLY